MSHANARLTFHARVELVRRVRQAGRPIAHVAAEMGVSRQCGHRWVARFDAEGWDGLRDRSSRPRSCPTRTPVEVEAVVLACRDAQRIGRDRVAEVTGVPARTVSRILTRHGRPPLAVLDPVTGMVVRASRSTAVRYERPVPGDLVHIDVKKLGKIPDGGGWRAPRPRGPPQRQARAGLRLHPRRRSTTTPGSATPRSCPTRRAPPAPGSGCAQQPGSPPTASPSGR